ncbi:MAG TPA: M50 family metallopeptidase [Capsulimonadaceae bacterium]|jgi:hypothetical protein
MQQIVEFGTFLFAFLAMGVGACVGALVIIAVHELGHLWAGTRLGLQWVTVKIGPLIYQRARQGEAEYGTGWQFGYVAFDDSGATKRQLNLTLLAGPAASIVFALCAADIPKYVMHTTTTPAWLSLLSMASMAAGLLNLIPFRRNWFLSDGYQLWRLNAPSSFPRGPRKRKSHLRMSTYRSSPDREDLPKDQRVNINDLPKL